LESKRPYSPSSYLLDNIKLFRDGLRTLGCDPISDPQSPIVPVIIGDMEKMGIITNVLVKNGIFVNTVIFPAVSKATSRLRLSISAAHSESDIQMVIFVLKNAFAEAKLSFVKKT
jgi:8-amino-7-oxononanoate synthase